MEKTNRSTGILLKKIQIIGNSFKNLARLRIKDLLINLSQEKEKDNRQDP